MINFNKTPNKFMAFDSTSQQRFILSLSRKQIFWKTTEVSNWFTSLFRISPELQLKDTESGIKSKLIELLTQLKVFKFVKTLSLVYKKMESKDKRKYENFYSSSKAGIIINESGIDDVFKSICTAIITKIFRKKLRLDYWFSQWS